MCIMCTLQLAIQSSVAFCGFVLCSFANLCGHTKNKIHHLDPSLCRRIRTVQRLEQLLKLLIVHDVQEGQGVVGAL
jgi:hypothetical protein